MKQEVTEYYRKKGFVTVYVYVNNESRKMAQLIKPDGTRFTTSYAKYLYTSHYQCDVNKDEHIDHINGDKTDDRIENLQKISGRYNRQKDHVIKEMLLLTCPVCGKEFLFEKRNLNSHPNPCCSRRCGGIKSHWK